MLRALCVRRGAGVAALQGVLLMTLLCAECVVARAQDQRGFYKCYFNDYPRGLTQSSIGNLRITSPSTYEEEVFANGRSAKSGGTFSFTPMSRGDEYGKLTFHGGVLDGHWAYANRKANGDRAIIWPNDEGEKLWDRGATWCYYDPKG